ncbi:MAG TPA: MFS transporter [Syntrophorhabdales bacterium]|nr:MFS transporter [Syntrophorhabdales bacterium]
MSVRDEESGNQNTLRFVMRALRNRNYRLFFAGQGISLIGTWMQRIAMSWLVYRLTNSAFLLGLVGFAGQIPTFLFASFAGVFVDRWDRHRLLLATQVLAMVQASLLALLTLTKLVAVWHIFVLAVCLGLVNAFDTPTRQSFVIEMLDDRKDLGNAIALNSFMVNGARLVGPSLAGITVAAFGEGICFLLNGLSFLAIIISLLAMKIHHKAERSVREHPLQGLKEGYRYAFGFAPIRYLLMLLALASFMGMPYAVLMPIFARDILRGGPHTLGFLMGAAGIGALISASYLASRKSVLGLGRVIVFGSAMFGCGLILFSLSRYMVLSLVFMVLTGFGMMTVLTSCNTILQTIVDEDKRGRVMSLYAMAFMGMVPFGSLMGGSLASSIGAPATLMFGGACCIAASFLFARKLPELRRVTRAIYVDRGIIKGMPTE